MRNILHTTILSLVVSFFWAGTAFAALDLVNFSTTPKNPTAGDTVLLRVESFAVNLNTATLLWSVDGELVKEGVAVKDISVTAPEFGKKLIVDVIILAADGRKIDKQYVLAPSEVDVLWEAQTYTPPFYKGKALPTFKSLVRVTAIPRFGGLTSNPKEYYYQWTYNRNLNVGEALGKNSVVIPMGYADSAVPVTVNVSMPETDWKGVKSISVEGSMPKIVLYENDPLLGIKFNRPMNSTPGSKGGNSRITGETQYATYAVPYFFSTDDLLNNKLIFRWEVNRKYTSPGLSPRYLTLLKPETGNADYNLSLRVQNPNRILQDARANAEVSFVGE